MDLLPGMPPVIDLKNMYSETTAANLSPAVKGQRELVYVPNAGGNTVSIIDPKTFKVIDTYPVGREPQHVVPSYDLQALYATNDQSNTLSQISPVTGKLVKTIKVDDPYNLYFTPDGKHAIVVAERMRKLDFRNPKTFELVRTLNVPCRGVDHLDFSIDGKYLIATCEYSGELIKVDVAKKQMIAKIGTPGAGNPQDIKASPDGKVFYVADMDADGVHLVDGDAFKIIGFLPTGKGAHGLYVSRDFKYMYVSNRGEGSISLIDLATRQVAKKWKFPGGGSPDMGNLSADGKVFWLAGRYHHEVYAVDTTDGKLLARIKVGRNPHGLCVWPQPGRYSIGHTGIMR
ncbi:MAG TPA: YncE family protein [Bryobacteraceae bacterium]|nr:YncE family protein [Bryobacteraceae bacterium]